MSEPIPEEDKARFLAEHGQQNAAADDGESRDVGRTCRMYAKEHPSADEVVMVQVEQIAELGAYVTLLEYKNVKGMILASELTRRRIRSMNRVIRVGRMEAVVVLRVDTEKGFIDLSKRRVTPGEVTLARDRYARSRQVRPQTQTLHSRGWRQATPIAFERVYLARHLLLKP